MIFNFFKKRFEKRKIKFRQLDRERRNKIINDLEKALFENLNQWVESVKIECYYGKKMGYGVEDVFMATIEYKDMGDHWIEWKNSPEVNVPEIVWNTLDEFKMHQNGIGGYTHGIPGKITAKFFQEFWPKDQYDWDEKMKKYRA